MAFSRDGPLDKKKIYVQDVISKHGKVIYDYLIKKNGVFFISGSSGKMPQGVKDVVIEIIKIERGISREEAEKEHSEIERLGRWKQETW